MPSGEAPKPFCLRPAYVFFASASRRKLGFGRRVRIAKRFPKRTYQSAIAWLTSRLSGSEVCHVAIGHNGVVLDPSLGGNRFWPLCDFIERYPNLAMMVVVPLASEIDIASFQQPKPVPLWTVPSFIRLITGGRTPATNCVSIVAECLRRGGVETPRRLVTPLQLLKHLEHSGHQSQAICGYPC